MPELSKWEREDQGFLSAAEKDAKIEQSTILHGKEKVTSEVLRKAENAIFTRAINAIRPTESNRSNSEIAKTNTADKLSTGKRENAKELIRSAAIKTFQITVPASSQERSVEIKSDNSSSNNNKQKSQSPKLVRSVKERLGRKVVGKAAMSPPLPDREVTRKRSHSIDRNFTRNDARDKKRRVEPIHNRFRDRNINNRQHDDNNTEKKSRVPSRLSRERDREREREREREKDIKPFGIQQVIVSEKRERMHEKYDDRQTKNKEDRKSSTEKTEKTEKKVDGKTEKTDVATKNENTGYKVAEKTTNKPSSRSRESRSRSTTADDDDSDSDETKRKRRRRNKKDKKRSKRSSSEESAESEKRKHLKSKKRNKSERKKKKSKK